MNLTKSPAKERKMWQEKRKKRGGEKAKSKSQDCCVTFKPQNLEILLSTHASQPSISVEQRAAKCTTCKRLCDTF